MLSAFMTPAQLIQYSSVPSFSIDASHLTLSESLENEDLNDIEKKAEDPLEIGFDIPIL